MRQATSSNLVFSSAPFFRFCLCDCCLLLSKLLQNDKKSWSRNLDCDEFFVRAFRRGCCTYCLSFVRLNGAIIERVKFNFSVELQIRVEFSCFGCERPICNHCFLLLLSWNYYSTSTKRTTAGESTLLLWLLLPTYWSCHYLN